MTNPWQEAIARLEGSDLLQLGMDANAVREQLWPERIVSYIMGFPLSLDSDWLPAAEAAIERGARSFLLTAGTADSTRIVTAMRDLQARFRGITLTGFSAGEILKLSAHSSIDATLKTLRGVGLTALGHGEETLSQHWSDIHRAAHSVGLPSTAAILLRASDSPAQWIAHLEQIAIIQDETHGFLACEPRIEHLDRALDEVTGARYLQFLAITRIYLPAIPHLQADWSIFGPKVLQLALRFGADDAGLVLASARDPKTPSHHSGEEELRRIIRDAGFAPSPRDAIYSTHFIY